MPTKIKTKTKTTKSAAKTNRVKPVSKAVSQARPASSRKAAAPAQSMLLTNDMLIAWTVLIIIFLLFVIKIYGI